MISDVMTPSEDLRYEVGIFLSMFSNDEKRRASVELVENRQDFGSVLRRRPVIDSDPDF